MGLICNGAGNVKTLLDWSISLDERDKTELFREEIVSAEASVKLKNHEGLILWPSLLGGIRINESKYGASINVKHTRLKVNEEGLEGRQKQNLGGGSSMFRTDTYVCNWPELEKGSEETIYSSGMQMGFSEFFLFNLDMTINVQLSRSSCQRAKENTKQTICDLKNFFWEIINLNSAHFHTR